MDVPFRLDDLEFLVRMEDAPSQPLGQFRRSVAGILHSSVTPKRPWSRERSYETIPLDPVEAMQLETSLQAPGERTAHGPLFPSSLPVLVTRVQRRRSSDRPLWSVIHLTVAEVGPAGVDGELSATGAGQAAASVVISVSP